ncbi:hypothetical protein HMF7854_04480 [Sphingomonas ginkgonis]|uniref:Uncharacterized protein n=1 Tax=Sphingomonas ginkgonis TaxID=2315330 RepID=A0A3R9WMV3_9SPHN|nr:hypothetical protein [Sphingomonas ginkgonis]RST30165.1 hypothetical protein HMF7854_04480 [Sphingomonas ginkgonis]
MRAERPRGPRTSLLLAGDQAGGNLLLGGDQSSGVAVIDLGELEVSPTIGITDYSRRVTDDFGVTTVAKRGFSRTMSVRLALPSSHVDAVQRSLASVRSTEVRWVADDRYDWLSVNGFYKDFSLDLAVPPTSFCTLTIEGLAETETTADDGSDPAPDSPSTLKLLEPMAVVGAALASSTVPENDFPAWANQTGYAQGSRVISTATHRIYECSVPVSLNRDPTTTPDDWTDVGPTNRWAMFDQALGTATSGARSMQVEINASGVDAVALLNVVGSSVRVQAPGYDRMTAVSAGTIGFLDLPQTTGRVTVTITGAGTVSVGTLILGTVRTLGITEASPTAGINDYSKKTIDEFGSATVVARSWAKKMNVRALIRTEALDLVANRIASVRATPSLWIGDEGTDSLTIYGFFKDFSIEVGDTVSTLALSVEGLSEAAPLAGTLSDLIDSLLPKVQWSSDGLGGAGASAWHETYVDRQDFFQRQSTDNGITWGPAIRVVASDRNADGGGNMLATPDDPSSWILRAGAVTSDALHFATPFVALQHDLDSVVWSAPFSVIGGETLFFTHSVVADQAVPQGLDTSAGLNLFAADGTALEPVNVLSAAVTTAEAVTGKFRRTGSIAVPQERAPIGGGALKVVAQAAFYSIREGGAAGGTFYVGEPFVSRFQPGDVTSVVDGPGSVTFKFASDGTPEGGEFPRDLYYSVTSAAGAVTPDRWDYVVLEGAVNNISAGPTVTLLDAPGVLHIASMQSDSATIVVRAIKNGATLQHTLVLNRLTAPPPAPGTTTTAPAPSGGGAPATSTAGSSQSSGFAAYSSTSPAAVSAALGINVTGSSATISVNLYGSPQRAGGADDWTNWMKVQHETAPGSGVWVDVGGEEGPTSSAVTVDYQDTVPPRQVTYADPAHFEFSRQATGLAAGNHNFRVVARCSAAKLHYVTGSVSTATP